MRRALLAVALPLLLASIGAIGAIGAIGSLAGCERDRSTPALYKNNCARCHGAQGQGPRKPVKLYPHLSLLASPMVRRGDRAAVRQQIVEGDGPMPSFRRRLSPAEVERLVDFTLQLPSRKAGT